MKLLALIVTIAAGLGRRQRHDAYNPTRHRRSTAYSTNPCDDDRAAATVKRTGQCWLLEKSTIVLKFGKQIFSSIVAAFLNQLQQSAGLVNVTGTGRRQQVLDIDSILRSPSRVDR
jgi:pyruvate/2-oxoglutarate/acetoin dehydrogenase E1 component